MWTFENAPLDWFEEAYGFAATPEWLEHARLSALRFGSGCSASFVSPRGLIVTNHHCARSYVAALSPAGEDWLLDGHFARSLDGEVPIPGLSVQQLVSMQEVTDRVAAGETEGDILAGFAEEHPDLTHQLVSLSGAAVLVRGCWIVGLRDVIKE